MALEAIRGNLQKHKQQVGVHAAQADAGKQSAQQANNQVQQPSMAQAYMSHALVATQAKNSIDAAQQAQQAQQQAQK